MISRNTNVLDAAERKVETLTGKTRQDLQWALEDYHTLHTAEAFDRVYNLLHRTVDA